MTLEYSICELKKSYCGNYDKYDKDELKFLENTVSNRIDELNVNSPILHIFPIVMIMSSVFSLMFYFVF
jgi:hypothetical protein